MKQFPITVFLCLLIVSCEVTNHVESLGYKSTTEPTLDNLKISKDIENLCKDDAINVAKLYNSNKPQTKQNKTFENVVNVVSLCDNDGSPIIYAINFDDGFILVSATKKYFPILAEVEHGTFNLNSTAAYDILLNDYIDDIKYFNNQPQLEAIKEAWSIYENYSSPLMQTKSSINDDYYDLLNEYVNIWESEGYNYYFYITKI